MIAVRRAGDRAGDGGDPARRASRRPTPRSRAAKAAFPAWRAVAPGDRVDAAAAASPTRSSRARRGAGDARGAQRGQADRRRPRRDRRWSPRRFRYYAGAPERLLGETIPVAGGVDMTFREPLGVVGLIVPWNFPLVIASWKVAPALAAGNTIVLKPAELTPLTALELERIALDAGLPEGVLNVVAGPGSVCGQRLVEHPDVAKIAFTGSTEVGRGIAAGAARDDQAGDARARRQVRQRRLRRRRPRGGRGRRAVRRCSATPARTAARARGSWSSARRMDEFMARAGARRRRAMRVGDPLDEETEMGPLISADQRETVGSYRRRRRAGRDPRLGARRPRLLVRARPCSRRSPTTTAPRARRSSARSPA